MAVIFLARAYVLPRFVALCIPIVGLRFCFQLSQSRRLSDVGCSTGPTSATPMDAN